jgi:DNA-binding MarR family transcriptional regulator
MVTLVDELEAKGYLQRRPDPADRRRNIVALTGPGRTRFRQAQQVSAAAEREFLRGLTDSQAAQLAALLRAAAFPAGPGQPEAAPGS